MSTLFAALFVFIFLIFLAVFIEKTKENSQNITDYNAVKIFSSDSSGCKVFKLKVNDKTIIVNNQGGVIQLD